MKITFLGTGTSSGIPLLTCTCDTCKSKDIKDKRLRSSIFIETKGKQILIDAGPDFRQQMLRENINRLDAVLITHSHNDHIAGLDELRAYNFSSGKYIDIYTNSIAETQIRKHFDYIFAAKRYPGIAMLEIMPIDKRVFSIGDIEIIPIEVMHHKLPVTAFRIGNFAYVTDIKSINDVEFEKLVGVKTLIISALRHTEHISHFSLNDALEFAEKLQVKTAYFTHISHQMGKHKEFSRNLPENIQIAYDGLKILVF